MIVVLESVPVVLESVPVVVERVVIVVDETLLVVEVAVVVVHAASLLKCCHPCFASIASSRLLESPRRQTCCASLKLNATHASSDWHKAKQSSIVLTSPICSTVTFPFNLNPLSN